MFTCPYCQSEDKMTEVHTAIVSEEAIVNIAVRIDRRYNPIETNFKLFAFWTKWQLRLSSLIARVLLLRVAGNVHLNTQATQSGNWK